MTIFPVLIVAASVILSGCCSTPKENEQHAFEFELTETTLFMQTLTALDSGDIAKTRRLAEIPVFVDIVDLPLFATKGHPTPEEKQELVVLARQVLDYLQRHKSQLDPRLPTIRAAMTGLRKIMTEPEDIRRLQGLSDYFAAVEAKFEKDNRSQ